MENVEGWKVGTWYGHEVYKVYIFHNYTSLEPFERDPWQLLTFLFYADKIASQLGCPVPTYRSFYFIQSKTIFFQQFTMFRKFYFWCLFLNF